MKIHDRPVLTDVLENLSDFTPETNSAYIFSVSTEERSGHAAELEKRATDLVFVHIENQSQSSFTAIAASGTLDIQLRSSKSLLSFWKAIDRKTVYLDITGLEHQTWAPLLRSAIGYGIRLIVVYIEPKDYRFSATPRDGDIFDLSERIEGISPLPGFAVFEDSESSDFEFVALLGFEGVRFKYMLEQTQPAPDRITPVVGVPGFRLEYPFFAFEGNRPVLEETMAWSRARFARANCPFSLYYTLDDIAVQSPWSSIKIGLLGTKPHALGAVLFAILSGRPVELVYDNPIRKPARTVGAARVLVYHVSNLTLSTAGG